MLNQMRPLITKTSCIIQTQLDNMEQILIIYLSIYIFRYPAATHQEQLRFDPLRGKSNAANLEDIVCRFLIFYIKFVDCQRFILSPNGTIRCMFFEPKINEFQKLCQNPPPRIQEASVEISDLPSGGYFFESSAAQTMVQNGLDATV